MVLLHFQLENCCHCRPSSATIYTQSISNSSETPHRWQLPIPMAKSFNLKCHRFLSSFRFCRPKYTLTFPGNPLPLNNHKYKQSPANPMLPPPVVAQKGSKGRKKTKKKNKKKNKEKQIIMTTNCWSNGYDGEEDEDENEEREGLIDSSKSFSDEFPYKGRDSRSGNPLKKGDEKNKTGKCMPVPAWKRAGKVEGKKVRESLVMVKRSEKPYEEFKRSMVHIILEEEIFEAKGLEELLWCYLSLNSPEYRGVIVEAFSEVWDFLFSNSYVNK